jgi:hypothetical protein
MKRPAESLILYKPTHGDEHGGGERYQTAGWEHRLISRWIESGAAPVQESDADIGGLEIAPPEVILPGAGERAKLRVIARSSDGSAGDVTPQCRYQTNDESIAEVDSDGVVTSKGCGDTHVVAFYDSAVGVVPVLRPVSDKFGEAGVRFVSVDHGGWDTHDNIFPQMKYKLLPELDSGLAGLFAMLDQKGLLATTTVFVTGEFGRTPKLSTQRVGRDRYPRAMFVLLAGGGVNGGQVIGASDAKGEAPADGNGMSPDDVAASFYHTLGIDAAKEYRSPTGRPVAIVRHGTLIHKLFS